MVNNIKIYMAGTIYNEEPDKSWKYEFTEAIEEKDPDHMYVFFDPNPKYETSFTMVARDKQLIQKCDIFVAYIQKASVGTSMEILYAHQFQTKPILIINPNQKFVGDLWLTYHMHEMFTSVEGCVKHIFEI